MALKRTLKTATSGLVSGVHTTRLTRNIMRRKWETPKLIVLVREDSGIAVLETCKNNPTVMGHIAPDSIYWLCAKVVPYCTSEACNAWTNS